MKLGKHVSDSWIVSTCSPQGCPVLFSLYTNSCTSSNQSIKLLKVADNTILTGLISGDESAYRWEVGDLVTGCGQNNLEVNTLKTVEMIVDFRKNPTPLWHHCQGQTAVYHSLCWEGDWLQSAISPGPVHLQDPEASRKDCSWPLPPQTQFFWGGHFFISLCS